MECTFVTNQGERISRLRFVVKELTKVLRHQITIASRFNIVAYNKTPKPWSDGGPMEASPINILNACNWLRSLEAIGPTHTALAIDCAYRVTGTRMDEMFLITDGDPSNGIDHDMALLKRKMAKHPNALKPKLHVCAIVLGSHAADDVLKTETYVYDLAEWGGGLCRFLVDDSYQNSKTDARYIWHERQMSSYCIGFTHQCLNVVSFLVLCFTIWCTQSYTKYTGRRTYLDMMKLIPTFLNPDPSIFRFWVLILALNALMILHLFRFPLVVQRQGDKDDILRGQVQLITWKLPALYSLTSLFLLSLQSELLLVAVILSFLCLILLCMLHSSLEIGKHPMKYNRPSTDSHNIHTTARNVSSCFYMLFFYRGSFFSLLFQRRFNNFF